MNKKVLCIFVILFLFGLQSIEAQQDSDEIPLTDVLLKLETVFDINFSFADNNINDKFIIAPDYKSSKEAIITYIENATGLTFIAINSKSYAIKASKDVLDFITLQNLQKVIITSYLTKGIKLNDDATTTITPKSFGILP